MVYTVTGCCTVIRLTVKKAGDEVSQLSGNSVKERERKRNTRKGKRSTEDEGKKRGSGKVERVTSALLQRWKKNGCSRGGDGVSDMSSGGEPVQR